ncbi:MAG: winged helix-turn-helix domain-containing protein, partial [Blastocatellia bacterium]|nr:winged helix-turn-helix domain-containing protein [Blastocatellia bacterium]
LDSDGQAADIYRPAGFGNRVIAMRAKISQESLIRFEDFELALKSGELRKAGTLVKLQPQPFKVLVLLATHAGELVTREEIQQQIWEGETFVDFEHGLNFCVKRVRAALGDNAQAPRFIETLPRRGYRFIAPVEYLNGADSIPDSMREEAHTPDYAQKEPDVDPARDSEMEKVAPGGPAILTQPRAIVIIVLAAALIAALYFAWNRSGKPFNPPAGKAMLVVLPFENLTGDSEQDYFSDGLTEEMIAELGRLQPERLGVIARTSSMIYRAAGKDIRQIGRELGVAYVIEGSVRREGDRTRITVQLIQVSDQTHLWSETYERSNQNLLKIQSEVAERVARSLAFELLPAHSSKLLSGSTRQPEAYDAYLKGRYLWNKGGAENLKKSIAYFEQAVEKDPSYGLAYAGLSDCYRLLGITHRLSPLEAFPNAKETALKALEIDDTMAEAHAALGSVKLWFEWDWPEAEREFKRAIALNPSYGPAHHDYAWFLVAMGRFDEGIAEIKRAQELDPLSPLANSDVGWVYLRARLYDEAIAQIKRTLELEPDFGSAHACLEHAYYYKGMYAEALEIARREIADLGASPEVLSAIAGASGAEGIKIVKRWRLNRRLETAKQRSLAPYGFATLYAAVGDKDRAFEWLERAFEEGDPSLISIKVDPALDPLRADPRFDDLLRRIGFPE